MSSFLKKEAQCAYRNKLVFECKIMVVPCVTCSIFLQKYSKNRSLVNHKLKEPIRHSSFDLTIYLFCYEPDQLCSSIPTPSLLIRQPALSRKPTTLPSFLDLVKHEGINRH